MTGKINKRTPINRLNYSGDLKPVINRLSKAYTIGIPDDFSVIEVGYEDCNVIIYVGKDKYLAKIFQKDRTPEDIDRYTTIMERAIASGVNHPSLLQKHDGGIVYSDKQANGLNLILMDYIDGNTFFELNRPPNNEERKSIIEQAAKVNKIDYKPTYIFDSWAIPNIQILFDKTKQYLKPEDIPLVEQTIKRYKSIPADDLPHAFVHGDFTKANVLKSKKGDIYILDFSVANWYPRIQEIAVIAANLMHDDNSVMTLRSRIELIANEYDKFNKLTPQERKWLYDYTVAGVAMELLGGYQEKYINRNDTKETEYWISLGHKSLIEELS